MLTRRTLLSSALNFAGAFAIGAGADGPVAPRYFLLESYHLKTGSQAQRLGSYLQRARIGMAHQPQTVPPALVLEALVAAHMPQVLAVSAFASLEELARMRCKLRRDRAALEAMAQCKAGAKPRYEEMNETVLEAAEHSPPLAVRLPSLDLVSAPPPVFELRTYHSPTTRQLRALHEHFVGDAIRIFHRCGIHPVLYSSALIGGAKPKLTYLTPFADLAARDKAWAAFSADLQWAQVRAESIANYGQLPSVIQLSLFKAAAYSPVVGRDSSRTPGLALIRR